MSTSPPGTSGSGQVEARLEVLLGQARARHPDAMATLVALAAAKGTGGGPDWPGWCWLPMGATAAYLNSRGHGLVDLGALHAVLTWWLGRDVVVPGPDLAAAAVAAATAPGARLPQPAALGAAMPSWCPYVVVEHPDDTATITTGSSTKSSADSWSSRGAGDVPDGAFVHLEADANTGRPELRMVVDYGGDFTDLVPAVITLDRPDLASAATDMAVAALAGAAGHPGADVRALPGADGGLGEVTAVLLGGLLPLALLAGDPDALWTDPANPTRTPAPARPGPDGRWRPARTTTTWAAGYTRPRPTLTALP